MSRLIQHLLEIIEALEQFGIRHAAIGSIAMVAHGVVRATANLDFLVLPTDAASLDAAMERLGLRTLHTSRDSANYVRDGLRVELVFASRPIALQLLESGQARKLAGHTLSVVSVAGLIALKVQALVNDPHRQQDTVDIRCLLRAHREQLDLHEIEQYFALFGQTRQAADWLAELRDAPSDIQRSTDAFPIARSAGVSHCAPAPAPDSLGPEGDPFVAFDELMELVEALLPEGQPPLSPKHPGCLPPLSSSVEVARLPGTAQSEGTSALTSAGRHPLMPSAVDSREWCEVDS